MSRIFALILLTIITGVALTNPQLIRDLIISQPKQVIVNPVIEPNKVQDKKVVERENITKSEVYKWVDENGKIHYSDKSANENELPSEKITVITKTTEFAKTPYINRINSSNSTQTSSKNSRSNRCKGLKKQATIETERLRRAGRSPTRDRKLREKRWEIIKNC
ncbi:MAG: DUF4124 domain-containing protein [Kangiellaceae bacterium]|nr:DUF4124 domain-containing protein [Kangiellaceae bacterium]